MASIPEIWVAIQSAWIVPARSASNGRTRATCPAPPSLARRAGSMSDNAKHALSAIKLCINCCNMRKVGQTYECHAPQNVVPSDLYLVTGEKAGSLRCINCTTQRKDVGAEVSGYCGPKGAWFEPKADAEKDAAA